MNIIDLTGGYSELVEYSKGYEKRYAKKRWIAAAFSSNFRSTIDIHHPKIDELIDSVPVFLVNKELSNKVVEIPGYNREIRVPNDVKSAQSGVDINQWKESKKDSKITLNQEHQSIGLLGLYEYVDSCDFLPRRIFVWIDKIQKKAEEYVKKQSNCIVDEMANALFDVVLSHERGHALMDVELYGEKPSPKFNYGKDYIYFFIEEAYANAFALATTMKIIKGSQKTFIEDFIKGQPAGYKDGWNVYQNGYYYFSQWMHIKCRENFMNNIDLLVDFWKTKDFSILSSQDNYGN